MKAETTEMHAEVLAALLWGPKKTTQLQEVTGMGAQAVARWLDALHASGVVRIAGEVEREGPGRRERIWEVQPEPFKLPDWNPRLTEREAPCEGS